MRVYDQNLNGAAASQTGGARPVERGGGHPASGARGGGGDRVELSSTLGVLSRVLAAHQSDRTDRVQELAAQYRSGAYNPDSLATSRAMTADALAARGLK